MQSGYVSASYVKGKLDARKAFFFPGFSENWAVLDGDRKKDQPNYCSYSSCSPDEMIVECAGSAAHKLKKTMVMCCKWCF